MSIACLGWGSLVWDPRSLPVSANWKSDGPVLPLEFARKSKNGRVTLVITDQGTPCEVLWNELAVETLGEAVAALAEREEMPTTKRVGSWPPVSSVEPPFEAVAEWAIRRGLNGVVWTGLGANWDARVGGMPTFEDIVLHLQSLSDEGLQRAADYIRKAPAQIATAHRKTLEEQLLILGV